MDHKKDSRPNRAASPPDLQDGPRLSEYEFRLLRDYIHDTCGIFYDDSKIGSLESRVRFRLRLLDITSFLEYYNYLKYNPRAGEEMQDLIPHLTNNETYFFREMFQLRLLVDDLMERIKATKRANKGKTIRVLSCGCSSGEEVFTLAMMFEEAALYVQGLDIRITGMDIDRKVLEKAGRGVYTSYSLRATEKSRISKFFEVVGDSYKLVQRVRSRVEFVRGNIMEPGTLAGFGDLDVILCRNVLIYFSDSAIAKIAEKFHKSLGPEGYLLLGHSESLTRITDIFHPQRFPNAIVYSKKG